MRRERLEIINKILSFCRRPQMKTHVIYRCGITYVMLQKYLKYLIPCGLLSSFKKNGREFFQVTEKGKKFLRRYENLKKLL